MSIKLTLVEILLIREVNIEYLEDSVYQRSLRRIFTEKEGEDM